MKLGSQIFVWLPADKAGLNNDSRIATGIITRAWGNNPPETANLKAFLDGPGDYWATSVRRAASLEEFVKENLYATQDQLIEWGISEENLHSGYLDRAILELIPSPAPEEKQNVQEGNVQDEEQAQETEQEEKKEEGEEPTPTA